MEKFTYEELEIQVEELTKLVKSLSKANAKPNWKTNMGEKVKFLCGYRQIKEKIEFPYNHLTEIYRLQIRILTAEDEIDKRFAVMRSALSWVKEKINCDFGETLVYDDGDVIFCEVSSVIPFMEEQEIPEPITLVLSKDTKD